MDNCQANIFTVGNKRYLRCIHNGKILAFPYSALEKICPSCGRKLDPKNSKVSVRLMQQVHILGGWMDLEVVEMEVNGEVKSHTARLVQGKV